MQEDERVKIIVADDMEINRMLLKEMFCEQYDVLEAKDGSEVINFMEKYKYDIGVILLDVYMPNMGGFDVLDYMKERGILEKIPVIVVTVSNAEATALRAYDYRVAEIVIKPFTAKIVKRRVNNIVEFYHSKQLLEQYIMKEMEKQKPPYRALLEYNEQLKSKLDTVKTMCSQQESSFSKQISQIIE